MLFETSGIEVAWWVPPVAAFIISTLFSTGGVTGAFMLLPFQVSVLGFTTPAVSATNHLFNVVAITGGVVRFIREGRMLWPLAAVIVAGTLPGVIIGTWIRVSVLPDPEAFKLFAGCFLLLIGSRLLWENVLRPVLAKKHNTQSIKHPQKDRITGVDVSGFTSTRIEYTFSGNSYSIHTSWLLLLTAAVGIMGGAYGVGGGAIIAPFLVSIFRLPVYTIAGATLFGTLATSVLGVLLYTFFGPAMGSPDLSISPDWKLGILFGIGGFAGIYAGARLQRFMPQKLIKAILAIGIVSVGTRYVIGFFQL